MGEWLWRKLKKPAGTFVDFLLKFLRKFFKLYQKILQKSYLSDKITIYVVRFIIMKGYTKNEQEKGLNLMGRMAIMALLPLILLFGIAQYSISSITNTVAEKLVNNMLASNAYAMDEIMILSMSNNNGSVDGIDILLENMKEKTGGVNFAVVDVNSGKPVVSTYTVDVTVDKSIIEQTKKAGEYFKENTSTHLALTKVNILYIFP